MAGTFDFCPDSQVPELLPPDPVQGMSMNGWNFSAKPNVPFQASYKVTLHGLRWHLQSNGLFDNTTNPTINARRLEEFYRANGTWDNFTWVHPHIGALVVRFAQTLVIPAGMPNGNGLIEPVEIRLVHHNPGF